MNKNEKELCEIITQQFEERLGKTRHNVSYPERDSSGPPVEIRFMLENKRYAIEHTRIEPFPSFFQRNNEFASFSNTIVKELGSGTMTDHHSPHALVQDILKDTLTMTLAVQDKAGPWAAPLVFINPLDYHICWVSMPNARHSLAIAQNPSVAITIVASDKTKQERALQMSAQVTQLKEPNLAWEQMLERKRGRPLPQQAGEILDKGHVWYCALPDTIYLLHTQLFGFERQLVI